METLESGIRLGPYEIVSSLGEGGMGAVYRARDAALRREVAIKVLLPAVAGDPDRLARFDREAQVLASLNHPNIAAIYGLLDVPSTGSGQANGGKALVLELVEGPTLADRMASGPILLDEALAIARQIADALEAAHEQGIVHRDLKPANIKLRSDGTVKVLDFGLATYGAGRAVGAGQAGGEVANSPTMSIHATTAGLILGTAAYMSPEQAAGKPVDKRADVFAFGVVLWEMVTGRRMFEGETISHVLAAVLTKEPDLTIVPPRVRRLLSRCLEKDPKKRLRDIGDAMSLADEAVAAPLTATPPRRWPVVVAWSAAAVLAAALAVALWSRTGTTAGSVVDAPVVRFEVERTLIDTGNNVALAAFAVSPDGRFLAHYVTDRSGQAILSVRTLATGESQEVPGSAVFGIRTPFWSSDSRQVAYVATQAARAFDLSTGTTRELCACRFEGGSWNGEGVILLGGSFAGEPIRRLSLQDRTPVAVTEVDDAKGEQDTFPRFLPDGRRFLFTRTARGSATVTFVGSLDGGEPLRAAEGSRRFFVMAPNGVDRWVLGIEAAGLVAQSFGAGAGNADANPFVVVAGAAAASMSDNGVLATSAAGGRLNTAPSWYDRKGTLLGSVGGPGRFYGSNLSPDERTVAMQEPGGSGIVLRDIAGAERRLTFNQDAAPAWSPDGSRIVVSSTRNGVVNLFERASDGSGPETHLFAADRNSHANDWSRDGRWVLYTIPKDAANSLDLDLWVFPIGGTTERTPMPYLTGPAREAQAEFSPDGRFVAYTSTGNGNPEVYVQPFPNASDGKWLVSAAGGVEPHWSRDGTELFYFAGQTLMAVPVRVQPRFSHGSPVRLFDAPVQPWYTNDSDRTQVSADGKRFLILVQAGENKASPIDVVVNWQALLKQ